MAPEDAAERFTRLYTETYSAVLAYALRRTSDRDDADDVVAATFLTAWRRLDDVLDAPVPLAWLYRVAAGHLANQRRSSRRFTALRVRLFSVPPPQRSSNPADVAAADTDIEAVLDALASLSAGDQELLHLTGFEGLSPAEIASAWGVPSRLVRVRLHRARRRLQTALDRQADGSDVKRTPSGGHEQMTKPSGASPDDDREHNEEPT